ncbi:hypothetical protein CCACVL1_22305 [Corchorus capsularis]|uniref:Uncharacterized protein n=1 Tax=Corchorus capsularis TaxID=210143 RepID=A0A1R3H0D2_COCAP|nr:hypothetical protein CCACVL1_22305 [Corchorus capsularis]
MAVQLKEEEEDAFEKRAPQHYLHLSPSKHYLEKQENEAQIFFHLEHHC